MAEKTFAEIVRLVDQLPEAEQVALTAYLLQRARGRPLTVAEKMTLLRAAQVDVEVHIEPSPRREDWYGDDGR